MIVMINGSFGVGKSTVARLLRNAMPGSTVYDPEWAGSALMRLSKVISPKESGTDDFQDIHVWRKLTVGGIRLFGLFATGPVIVPMTFTRRDYFDEVIGGLRDRGHDVMAYCLKAGLPTINQRLAQRGLRLATAESEWIQRRNTESLIAHRDPHFGHPVDTENRSAREVAEYIADMLSRPTTA